MPDEADREERPAEPLYWWERCLAGLFGATFGGLGAWSVFKTSNQAGSVSLITVGSFASLIAINGTPLLRARFKDAEWEMAKRRERRQALVSEAVLEPIEEARRLLSVLAQIDPGSTNDPAFTAASAYLYGREIANSLDQICRGIEGLSLSPLERHNFDFRINTKHGPIGVVWKYRRSGRSLPTSTLEITASSLRGGEEFAAGLVITPADIDTAKESPLRRALAQSDVPLRAVQWVTQEDDAKLRSVISELLGVMELLDD